ncbi:hypothetical protein [Sphingorhabdus sp.]|uniref:hypothetical protein n=1 Tax=Sphingorhabdus sp. TaxID=1902408 RepID=UPI003918DDCD
MTVNDDVAALVMRLAPHGICDDCIAEKLDLTVQQHANYKTHELAGKPGTVSGSGSFIARSTS